MVRLAMGGDWAVCDDRAVEGVANKVSPFYLLGSFKVIGDGIEGDLGLGLLSVVVFLVVVIQGWMEAGKLSLLSLYF